MKTITESITEFRENTKKESEKVLNIMIESGIDRAGVFSLNKKRQTDIILIMKIDEHVKCIAANSQNEKMQSIGEMNISYLIRFWDNLSEFNDVIDKEIEKVHAINKKCRGRK